MTLIKVPRPRRGAMDPERPVNALLQAQIEHLQHAERRIPLRYRSKIYTHAIRTEGEASAYIRDATEAIHKAHADAAAERARRGRRRRAERGIAIAAEADERAGRKRRPARSVSRKQKAGSKSKRDRKD
jgi:hypothetical protein